MIKIKEGELFYLEAKRKENYELAKIHWNIATQKYEVSIRKK